MGVEKFLSSQLSSMRLQRLVLTICWLWGKPKNCVAVSGLSHSNSSLAVWAHASCFSTVFSSSHFLLALDSAQSTDTHLYSPGSGALPLSGTGGRRQMLYRKHPLAMLCTISELLPSKLVTTGCPHKARIKGRQMFSEIS